ncbi:T9SS type A sorting domain-containing protein [Flavobacterium sp. N1994]|uniref:T9SS type A sorting domain-containing protein n=1 Tax=Flavobacterium sp. N1994 TaxID=2986827 RepID=UPI002222D776|nr:MopE-related protein [Flavobacterium sp. N1994]
MKKLLLLFFLMTFSLGYSQPGAGASAPPARNSWDVLSVFSDSYTPQPGTRTYNPGWGQAGSASVVSIGGNNVWSATNLNYQGLDFGGNINATAMTTFHVDVWTANETSLQFYQINNGGGERSYTLTPLVQNSWNSYDIPLTAWTSQSGFAVNALFQFKVVGSGGKTVYFDNMYFYRAATAQPPTYGAFTVPAKLTTSAPFTLTPPTSNNTSPFTYVSSNTAVATVSGSTVTIVGAGTSTITASQVADGTYGPGSTTASLVVTVPLPATPAPNPPARNAWDVISYYSDTNVGSVYAVASAPTWGGQTADTPISGNATKFLGSYLFGQIAFANKNVTSMSTIHLDLYSVDQTTTWLWLNNEKYIITPVTTGVWTSLDIPLSTFVVADKTAINIIKIESPTGAATPLRNVYVDNIYFYRAATLQPPTLGSLTVPSKVVGDAPFTLTNPTSNSSGAWTYTSSNTSVATISGNTVTVLAGGVTTITATQASDGTYGVGTVTAQLSVLPPAAPTPPVRVATNVISYYSDAYTLAATPTWSSSSTNADVSLGGNNARFVSNFTFGQIAFANKDVSAMSTIHVDVYSLDSSLLWLWVGTNRKDIAVTPNTWTSIDIPLSQYSAIGVNLTAVNIVKIENPLGAGTLRNMYVDNIYFYFALTAPTFSNFSSVAKVMGAAPFTLAATSTSPAAITYTSSNTAVATVSGSTVTVVGVGTSTLTASQVATGSYAAGSATATLTVTGSTTPLAGPTAPPARNSWDVISVFSDAAYTAAPGTRGYNPSWGQAGSASVVSLAGDNAWRATNLNYQGLDFGANVNVSAMTTFHVDVWTFDETSLQFFQINNGGGERSYTLTPLVQGQWNSYDIPITAWTSQSGFAVNALFQFKVVGSGGKTVYFDNMYFYRPATTQPPTYGAFTIPSKVVGDADFNLTPPTSNNTNPITYSSGNTAVATVTGTLVHIVGPGTAVITASQISDGTYGAGSTTATLTVTPPAAPTPITRNTWDVVSLYSDAYTTSSSPNLAGFGTGVTLSGNNGRFLTGSPTYRLAFTSTDVSAMTYLHIDVYALNQSSWQFRLNDKAVTVGTPVNGWTSVDILLSDYIPSGLNLATVSYFDFFNPNGANPNSSYLDNIYFYRAATLPPATVGTFTVPAKVLGDAPFTLTPPTSNNTSPFTYSSSDTNIATISGSTLTVVGGGTATITASQVADGTYGPTSKTASLVVTYPAPGASPVPPVRDTARVVSMFTGTPSVYANAITAVRSSWTGATTMTTIPNGTNTCLQLDNLGFLGLVASSGTFSAVGMTNLHVDVYLNSPISNMFVVLVSTAADKLYNTGALVAGWNSLNINLATAYPGSPLGTIYGLKFEQNVGAARQIYLDNVYFSNDYYTFYADTDGDGFGDLASTVSATTAPSGYVSNSTDCNDSDPDVWRSGDFYIDVDGDGYNLDIPLVNLCYGASLSPLYSATSLGVDCDDNDPAIHAPLTPSVQLDSSDADNSFCTGTSVTFTATASNVSGPATTGDAVVTYTFKVNGSSVQSSIDNTYTTTTLTTGQIVTVDIDITGGTCRTSDTASSTGITNTVNPLPTVTAGNVSGCAGSAITLVGLPAGGTFSIANPYTGPSTTYTYSYTNASGCSATSASATVTITAQPSWYLDADNDGYYTGTAVASCTSPGTGYTTASLFGGGDCNDSVAAINPGAAEVCYNNIDDNCNGTLSEGCAPVVVNMTSSYNNSTLVSLATAIPAVGYSYPGTSNIKYRFSVKNETTGVTAPDVIQGSRYVTIPAALHLYGATYTIKVSAVINDEVVPFAGNTITVTGPTVQLITLSSASCGATLATLASTISANGGLNATGYTFRIRLTTDNGPTPTYGFSSSATRFVGANSFAGFPLQYNTSYQVAVKYSYIDPLTSLPVESAYGAECSVSTPSIPLIGLAAPTCGSQVATMNAGITASPAAYATGYRFRIRLTSDNGPTPTYYYTLPNASRFSSLVAFQGVTFAYNTQYSIAVEYSILSNSVTQWSGFGSECIVKTPFFPVTSLVPSQCGLSTATSLTQQLNITPYPGFPNYKVKLDEISGESITNSQEIVITYSNFRLNQFSIAQLGKNYNVSVAIKLNGVFGDYSTACDLFTAAPTRTVKLPFKASAYPNPFANNFMLAVTTSSKSVVGVKVYDMVGRLIEQRQVNTSDIENTTIGDSYPSGIYNVVVSQEDSIETVRVIKR